MLDGTTAGVYSTSTESFLVSGLTIGEETAPGVHSVHTSEATSATKIATRSGPGGLYEADMGAIEAGLRRAAARPIPASYIADLSPKSCAAVKAELDSVRLKPPAKWYFTEEERDEQYMSALFPQLSPNPWTNLPVLPRTFGRASVERIMFTPVFKFQRHSKTRTPRPICTDFQRRQQDVFERAVDEGVKSNRHQDLQHRLLMRHRAMGHPSKRVFARMLELSEWKSDRDLAQHVRKHMPHCPECMVGQQRKRTRKKKSSGLTAATRFLQRLHVDCSALQPMASISGKKAYMLVVDEYTRYTWVFFITSTSECPKILNNFLRKMQNRADCGAVQHIQFIRSDGGPDFGSAATMNVLDAHGITHEIVNAGASNQNGLVERRIGVVAAKVRTALAWSQLPAAWWAEAVRHVVQTLNLTPSRTLPNCVSPYYMRTGRHHPTQLLRPFGCLASVYKKPEMRDGGKLMKAGEVGILLGYDERSDGGVQGYRVYNWDTNLTSNRFDVDFNPDLPGMLYVADLATNSVQMQFLGRKISKYFEETGRKHDGYVKKSHKGQFGEMLFEVHYDDGDHEDLSFKELLQCLVVEKSEVDRRVAQQYPRLARDDPRFDPYQSTEGSESARTGKRKRTESSSHATHRSTEGCGNAGTRSSSRIRKQAQRTNVSVLGDIDGNAVESTGLMGKPSRRAVLQAKIFGDELRGLPPEAKIDFDRTQARVVPEAKSFKQAMRGPYRRYWLEAARAELDSMKTKGVYEIVKLAPGERVRQIRGKWVLKVKKKADGTIEKFKARYVALGNTQRAGIDYRKTTAPVLNAVSLRTILAVATEMNWPLKQLDVSVAYLNSFLESDIRIFLAPPPGLYVPPGHACLARKGLYGLCQAGHRWAICKAKTLTALGFKRSAAEPCLWIRNDHRGLVITGIVVDDFIITGDSVAACDTFAEELMKVWDCTYIGDLEWCLNLRVKRDRVEGRMTVDQSEYVRDIVAKFRMQDAAPIDTPADPYVQLTKAMGPENDKDKEAMSRIPYSSAVGSVLYTRLTRIDCLTAIAEVARFMHNPGQQHWKAVKRIIRYLKSTHQWGLCYRATMEPGQQWTLTLYVDSSYANDPDKRRSRYGYIIFLNANPVSFGTGLSARTSSSTPEAEYVAMAHGVKELLWTFQTLLTIGISVRLPIVVMEDNQACIQIADNPVSQRRTRHMDVRYHFIRDQINDGIITVRYCATRDMLADVLTKVMPRPAFLRLRDKIVGDVMAFIRDDFLLSVGYCREIYNTLTR